MNAARSITVDLFCGFGGTSEGHRRATGRGPDVAVNHAPSAIANHARNFPSTLHLQTDVFAVDPRSVARGRQVDRLFASPDCGHYSRARGGKPRDSRIRDLGWVVVEWAREVRPRHIIVENVPEYVTWGPLGNDGQPDPDRVGETWRAWVAALTLCGYAVDWRQLSACDYGAPTTRRRLFVQARCDGLPIIWPEPTHGPGRARPWRTAAECIDWSVPGRSIFGRSKPLAEATERRIAEGLRRYVIEAPDPYLLSVGDDGVLAPVLIQTGYGEREGQRPRALDITAPLGTVVAGGAKHGLAVAWLAKHYTGVIGHDLRRPLGAVTTIDHHGLCVAQPGAGERRADAAAFLVKYYGQGSQWSSLREPMHTIVTKARMGLVTVHLGGVPYELTDITYRMLEPHELATAQGFGASYQWEGTKAERIAGIGHSVCPQVIEAIMRASH